MKALLLVASVFAFTLIAAQDAAADVIPSCPKGQHLVTGEGSSGHHGGGHCEPGPEPGAAPSSSASAGKKSGGCAASAANVERSTTFEGALLGLFLIAPLAWRRRSRRR